MRTTRIFFFVDTAIVNGPVTTSAANEGAARENVRIVRSIRKRVMHLPSARFMSARSKNGQAGGDGQEDRVMREDAPVARTLRLLLERFPGRREREQDEQPFPRNEPDAGDHRH